MTINELRGKRAQKLKAARAFLESSRNQEGFLSTEDDAAYTRMENEIASLGNEIARMERAMERTPAFTRRMFTDEERAYCERRARPAQHYAGRFAAREAVLKALGIRPSSPDPSPGSFSATPSTTACC